MAQTGRSGRGEGRRGAASRRADPGGGPRVRGGPLRAAVLRLLACLFLAAPALAQPGALSAQIVGTWELAASENVPFEDALVFARVTITEDRIESLYVFLDPDDGELISQRERGRYRVNDGQLVVRERDGVTVIDASRDVGFLTLRDLETDVVLVLREAAPGSDRDRALVGAWAGTRDGAPFGVRFLPDGTAEVLRGDDRDTGDYVVAGPYVLLGDEPARYSFASDAAGRRQLVVEADGERSVLAWADEPARAD